MAHDLLRAQDDAYQLYHGDCLEVLAALPANAVDTVITDPPYGLSDHREADVRACLYAWLNGEPYRPAKKGFMNAGWDAWVPGPEVWGEVQRVLKPGGHALVFAGTRSFDLMSLALRLAGFALRDSLGYAHDEGGAPLLAWLYAQGMPKSRAIGAAIDEAAGLDRPVVGRYQPPDSGPWRLKQADDENVAAAPGSFTASGRRTLDITGPASAEAAVWEGWGTQLRPSWEPILLAMKPCDTSPWIVELTPELLDEWEAVQRDYG